MQARRAGAPIGETAMADKVAKADGAAELRVNEKKWTPTLMKAGWTVLPNVIFERQQALGLDALDINILQRGLWCSASRPMRRRLGWSHRHTSHRETNTI
jgi:hypothetical protein